ncbi:MAG TPA: hypothetical protein VIJ12_09240 [Candidatus Baltobacteraceae bacterium]
MPASRRRSTEREFPKLRCKVIVPLALILAFAPIVPARGAVPITGYGVLVSGMQPMQAFARVTDEPRGVVRFDMWEVASGRVVRTYDIDMTKRAHMIVVTDDLGTFEHVHPTLQSNGHFTIALHLPRRALYHVYLDGLAHGVGRTVFRFDVPVGSNAPARRRVAHAAGTSVRVGPYVVTIDPTTLPVGAIATVEVGITKNGKPAQDLHPYLGAMAHGVFVGIDDLAYMHAHGMSQQMLASSTAGDCGDAMMMSMPPLPPGARVPSRFAFQVLAPRGQDYDFWLQFRGGTTLYTAPFLVTAR